MTQESLFETIVRVFEWYISPPSKATLKPPKPDIFTLVKRFKEQPVEFNDGELHILTDLAVRLLTKKSRDTGWAILHLCHILSLGGAAGYHVPIESGFKVDPFYYESMKAHLFSITTEIMAQAGIFRAGETPLYHDSIELFIHDMSVGRSGMLLLTDQRLFVVGPGDFEFKTGYRLAYPKIWRTAHWLHSIDYLEISKLGEGKVKNDVARFIYDTYYIKTSKHEFFGPLWIRFDLPDTYSIKGRTAKVYIQAQDIRRMAKGIPKDDAQRRIFQISRKIREIQTLTS